MASSSAAAASDAPVTSHRVVKAPDRGRVIVGRFDQIVTVTSQRQSSGALELPRMQKLRPDLDKCPSGLSMTTSERNPEITIGHTPDMRLPPGERPLGAEVYQGERQEMPSKHLIMWRRKDADGNDVFETSVVDGWFAFSKSTTLTMEAREQDPDEAERVFDQMQQAGMVRRSRVAGLYSRLAARRGLSLAEVPDGPSGEAGTDDGGAAGTGGSGTAGSGGVRVGSLVVEEKFQRVQVDDDGRFDDTYRSGFERDAGRGEGRGRRRIGYSGIHGSGRAVSHADREVTAEDDADLLGDFDAARQQEEALFTQFDDDDDAAAESAMLAAEDGAQDEGYEAGAEALAAAADDREEDDEDDGADADGGEDDAGASGGGGVRLTIMGGARMSVAQRRRRQQQKAEAAKTRAARPAADRQGAGAAKRGRENPDASDGSGGVGAGASSSKRARPDVRSSIDRLCRRLFVDRGGTVRSKTLEKFVSKLEGKYGKAGRSMALDAVGRMAAHRAGAQGESAWELLPEEWARAAKE